MSITGYIYVRLLDHCTRQRDEGAENEEAAMLVVIINQESFSLYSILHTLWSPGYSALTRFYMLTTTRAVQRQAYRSNYAAAAASCMKTKIRKILERKMRI